MLNGQQSFAMPAVVAILPGIRVTKVKQCVARSESLADRLQKPLNEAVPVKFKLQ